MQIEFKGRETETELFVGVIFEGPCLLVNFDVR
jgi:hypothetical protein